MTSYKQHNQGSDLNIVEPQFTSEPLASKQPPNTPLIGWGIGWAAVVEAGTVDGFHPGYLYLIVIRESRVFPLWTTDCGFAFLHTSHTHLSTF